MKTIVVPDKLLKIPFPWNITSNSIRWKYIDALDANKQTMEKALLGLNLSLEVLSKLHFPEGEHLPEDIDDYWMFMVEEIARKIPTFKEFDLAYVEKVFYEDKIESITRSMIEEAAETWIWTVTRNIVGSNLSWLEKSMNNCQDSELVNRYLAIASHYWQSPIPDELITNLVGVSKWIAGERAIPLLEKVEQTSQDKELADLARDFKRLMVDPNYG